MWQFQTPSSRYTCLGSTPDMVFLGWGAMASNPPINCILSIVLHVCMRVYIQCFVLTFCLAQEVLRELQRYLAEDT